MAKILNRITNHLICEDALLSIKELAVSNKSNLRGADLRRADLRVAYLRGAYLWEANLRGADLWGADLWEANLRGANLRGANLWEANLRGADLREAKIDDKRIISYKDVSGVGSSKRQLRCFMLDDNSFYFMTGCFFGDEKKLKEKVLEKYGLDCEYIESIEFLKKLCEKYKL